MNSIVRIFFANISIYAYFAAGFVAEGHAENTNNVRVQEICVGHYPREYCLPLLSIASGTCEPVSHGTAGKQHANVR